MRTAILGAFIASYGTMASAQNDCLKLEKDLDRLACYDQNSGRTPQVKTEPSAGKWDVQSQTSKMTDDVDVFLTLNSDETIDCGWNKGTKIDLVIRCMEKTTSVYFATGCHMASSEYDRYGDIEYRLDSEKTRTVSADASTDNKALGLWSGGKSIPIIKQLISKSQMTVRMTPFSENSFTASFNIAGLEEAIKPLRKACGW